MKRLAPLLPLLALAAVGCRKTTFTPDVVPASIQSYHQDPDGRLTLKIKCDSATAKGRAFLCSTKPAKGKGEPLASVRFQFYERGNIPGSEQLTLDADGTTEYSVDIDKLNAALAGIPEQVRPADRILHVFINQTEVGQWDLESPPAMDAPAASAPHAESATPRPGEAGPLPEGAAERSETGGVSHAESAEWRPTPEQTGRFRFDDKGKVVIAEVDAEGRVRLLENGPDSPPLRIRPATIRNRNLFVVEMDDIPDTGRHWTLALDFDAAKRAWIVVGEGETAADIVPEKPGYRTALFRRLDEPPSAPVP